MNDSFTCWVFPKETLSTQERKWLGEAIDRWCGSEQDATIGALCDAHAIEDLRAGEPPQPLALRQTHSAPQLTEESRKLVDSVGGMQNLTPVQRQTLEYEERPPGMEKVHELQAKLGAAATSQAFWLDIYPSSIGRERAIAGLRRHIPAELVVEILVDGTSWNK